MQQASPSHDLLTIERYPVRAGRGKRFINCLLDLFFFNILFTGAVILMSAETGLANEIMQSTGFFFVFIIAYALYMSLVETIFNGKSIGKLITGTRAVNSDGTKISSRTAFSRGFIKIIPFCAFSGLGNPCEPWQDQWTDTLVIDEKRSCGLDVEEL